MARAHGRDHVAAGGFQYLKGPEILNKWLGESEAAIRALFGETREFRAKHGYPCVVFLDEADALLGDRSRGTNVSINATTVPQFLAEMDGFDEPSAIFILATNRPDMLDAAVTREGRVDRKVRVGRPSQRDAAQILGIHLRHRPMVGDLDRQQAASEVAARIFSPGALVVRDYGPAQLELRHMVSGAMLAEVVEQATTAAMLRDVSEGRRTAGGIQVSDLLGALECVRLGQRDVDHAGVLRELAEAEREAIPRRDHPPDVHPETRGDP
jgi:proteasome-associated ATPase